MRLASRARKFVIFTLLALLLPAWAAGGLPLVWCVGLNGHSAIEALTLGDCHDAPEASFRAGKLSAKNGNCTDFSLWQRGQEAQKVISAASVSADPMKALFGSVDLRPQREAVTAPIRRDAGSDQLAQLRTVILLI